LKYEPTQKVSTPQSYTYRQLLEQLSVASLSRPTVFLQCYSLLLLYFWQTNNDNLHFIPELYDFKEVHKQVIYVALKSQKRIREH